MTDFVVEDVVEGIVVKGAPVGGVECGPTLPGAT
jgi:hypothetical protein